MMNKKITRDHKKSRFTVSSNFWVESSNGFAFHNVRNATAPPSELGVFWESVCLVTWKRKNLPRCHKDLRLATRTCQ